MAELDHVPARLRAAYTYAVAGRTDEARRIVRDAVADPQRELQAYHLATAYVGLGDHSEALRWLTLALRSQVYDVIYLEIDPRLDPLRALPEFQSLLHEGEWQ